MKHKTSELSGAMLDHAVALASGFNVVTRGPCTWAETQDQSEEGGLIGFIGYVGGEHQPQFSPSTNWRHGGPIIERERIGIYCGGGATWLAAGHKSATQHRGEGCTPLIAAMRAYCVSVFGEEVDL